MTPHVGPPGLGGFRIRTLSCVSNDAAGVTSLTLEVLLTVMDRTAANLERLQVVWDRAAPMLPVGPSVGTTPEYEDLARAWDDLRHGLPPIDGWAIGEPLPDMDAVGKAYFEYAEVGEPPFAVFGAKEAPGEALAEYRYRLNKARRRAVRDRMQELVAKVDTLLPHALSQAESLNSGDKLQAGPATEIDRAIAEIERLMGDTADRRGRWSDLHRHLRFGQAQDWNDITGLDWPSVKPDIEAAMFSDVEPLPVPDIDLGTAAGQRPSGPVSTELRWADLSADRFEHLLYDLLQALPGYQNVQLLMKTNAADRGRDISAERVLRDGAGTVRTERVIIWVRLRWREDRFSLTSLDRLRGSAKGPF